ncbi:hypothetical protein AAG570_001956 [Ranatra chinensis]|uniref:RNA pseudouridylate synthase domain-containing protein 2 n=1 Tax=Ranatra chinensis TaxID=642074 RepID=A0ABD0Y9Z9_9HEMI
MCRLILKTGALLRLGIVGSTRKYLQSLLVDAEMLNAVRGLSSLEKGSRLRKVYPYYFTFTTFTKGRWVGEKILDVFAREFRAHPPEEYERCIKSGSLTVNYEKVDVDYRLKHNDLLANVVHRSRPSVTLPDVETGGEANPRSRDKRKRSDATCMQVSFIARVHFTMHCYGRSSVCTASQLSLREGVLNSVDSLLRQMFVLVAKSFAETENNRSGLFPHEVPVTAEPISIVHMDEDVVVVNKPASIPSSGMGRVVKEMVSDVSIPVSEASSG